VVTRPSPEQQRFRLPGRSPGSGLLMLFVADLTRGVEVVQDRSAQGDPVSRPGLPGHRLHRPCHQVDGAREIE